MQFKKDYQLEFRHQARTLSPDMLGTNSSGWEISGDIMEDYYVWVNGFEATHPTLGWVRGDFETVVEASSQEAFEHFVEHHQPEEWDYWDI